MLGNIFSLDKSIKQPFALHINDWKCQKTRSKGGNVSKCCGLAPTLCEPTAPPQLEVRGGGTGEKWRRNGEEKEGEERDAEGQSP